MLVIYTSWNGHLVAASDPDKWTDLDILAVEVFQNDSWAVDKLNSWKMALDKIYSLNLWNKEVMMGSGDTWAALAAEEDSWTPGMHPEASRWSVGGQ